MFIKLFFTTYYVLEAIERNKGVGELQSKDKHFKPQSLCLYPVAVKMLIIIFIIYQVIIPTPLKITVDPLPILNHVFLLFTSYSYISNIIHFICFKCFLINKSSFYSAFFYVPQKSFKLTQPYSFIFTLLGYVVKVKSMSSFPDQCYR